MPISSRLARLVAATTTAASLAATFAIATPAQAGGFGPTLPGFDVPGVPTKPCEDTRFTFNPCLADYTADLDSRWHWQTVRQGVPAKFFSLTISNDGVAGGGPLFTTVGVDQDRILEVELVAGVRSVRSAPIGGPDGGQTWVVEHVDGLRSGEWTTVRVWVATDDFVDIAATANHHAGVELFGVPAISDHEIPEQRRDNNTDVDGY